MSETNIARSPRFSVVIPTRDRPEHVRNAVESVLLQTFPDFEIIVCDNHTGKSARETVEAFGDPRIRYITPDRPLSMHDNWDYAVSEARGDYVLVLIDKTMLRTSALGDLEAVTASHPADIYSWTSDAYHLTDEDGGNTGRGYLVPVRATGEPFYIDCAEELRRRLTFTERLGSEGPAYCYGKICFGAYSRSLVKRIKSRFGRLFIPISPDYTSMTKALLIADRLVDVNRSLLVSSITKISNGQLFSGNTAHARRFLEISGMEDDAFGAFPITDIFCSVHNTVAYDYRLAWEIGPSGEPAFGNLDIANLASNVERDLRAILGWASDSERVQIYHRFDEFLAELPFPLWSRYFEITEAHRAQQEALAREAAAPEKAVEQREAACSAREAAVSARELTFSSARLAIMFYISYRLRDYSLGKWFAARLAERQSATSASTLPTETPAEVVPAANSNGPHYPFPGFESVSDALAYAATERYTYPIIGPDTAPT